MLNTHIYKWVNIWKKTVLQNKISLSNNSNFIAYLLSLLSISFEVII